MDSFSEGNGRKTDQFSAHLLRHTIDYCSLVDPRVRPLMYSRKLDLR